MTKLTHSVNIQKPLSEVYDLARQVEKYPNFLPGYVESRIISVRENGALLERAARIRGKLVRWKSLVRWKENEAIHFIQQEGPLKGMWVNWQFDALTPQSTQLTITHLFNLSRPLGLGKIIENWIFKPRLNEIASQVIASFKLACETEKAVSR